MPLSANGFHYLDGSEVAGTGIPQNSEDLADDLEAKFFPGFTGVIYNGAWTDFGPTYEEVSYAKIGNRVLLRGMAKHATTTTTGLVFTLPAGYRPTKDRFFMVPAGVGFARLNLTTTGQVSIIAYVSSGNGGSVSFDAVSFDLAA